MRAAALDGKDLAYEEQRVAIPANSTRALVPFSFLLKDVPGDLFLLDLTLRSDQGEALAQNRYLFSTAENLAPVLAPMPASSLNARVTKEGYRWAVTLENHSAQMALWVWLEAEKADLRQPAYAYFDDNYFCLLPGEQREVQVEWSGMAEEARAISVSGWNFPTFRVRK